MIKSEKWYRSQIKALENATSTLHRQSEHLSAVYQNDLPRLFRATAPINKQFKELNTKLQKLQEEYYLYYR